MPAVNDLPIDLTEELRLRRWARENYVVAGGRDPAWPQIVLDEMASRDGELAEAISVNPARGRIVPLAPRAEWTLHSGHAEPAEPIVVLRLPALR